MSGKSRTKNQLQSEIEELRRRLAEMEDTLNAIRNGEVDGLIASGPHGEQVYSLKSADYTYRRLIEEMSEGAAILTPQGIILYGNSKLGDILNTPPEQVIGCSIYKFVAPSERTKCKAIIQKCISGSVKEEITFGLKGKAVVPVYLSLKFLQMEEIRVICAVFTDLTEQKRQDLIIASEKLARSILEQTSAAIVVIDEKGLIIQASRAAHELSGYNCFMQLFDGTFPLRVSSKKYKGLPENDDTLKYLSFSNILQKGKIKGIEAELIRSDGRLFNLHVSIEFLLDEKKNKTGYVVTMIDLTNLKVIESQLRKSEEQIKLLLNSTFEGIYGMDIEGNCTFCNSACVTILGYKNKNKLLGKNMHNLIHHSYKDGSHFPAENCKNCKVLLTGEGIHADDEVLWRADGSSFDAEYWSYPILKNNEIIGSVVTFLDITERKKAEILLLQSQDELRIHQIELEMQNEELQKAQLELEESRGKYSELYNFAPVGYFTFDKYGLILDVNFMGSGMLGVEKNMLMKKPFSLFITKDTQDKFYLHRKIIFKNNEPQTCDIKLIKKNGIQFDARLESVAMPDDKGDFNQLRTVINDITDYKRAQELLQIQKDIAVFLSNFSNLKKAIKEVLPVFIRLGNMDCGSVHLMNERTGALDLVSHRGLSAQFIKGAFSPDAGSSGTQEFMEGKSVYKDHSEIKTQADAAYLQEKIRALAFIPIVYDNKIIALLSVGSHTNDEIPATTRIALEASASQMGSAIIRTIFDDELKKYQLHLEKIVNERTEALKKTNVRLQNKITEHELAVKRLKIYQDQLRHLSRHIEQLREEDRKRIARELHDELGQSLTALKLDLLMLSDDFHENEKLAARIDTIDNFVSSLIKSVQKISSQLRPAVLDELGLKAAIEWLTDDLMSRTNITIAFVTNFEDLDISQDNSIALFRIIQETLTNVIRHAEANSIKIVLKRRNNHLHLLIQDNGKGIDKSIISDPKSLGLLGMHERAIAVKGDLKIRSYPGKGTTVTLCVPLKMEITA